MASSPDPVVAIGALASVASGAGALLSNYIQHPDEQYREKVKKLQKDRWSEVSTELGDIMSDVKEAVDESDETEQEDLTKSAKYSLVVQKEYNKDQLDGVVKKLEDVDEPKDLFQTCRESRDKAVSRFVTGFGFSTVGLILMWFFNNSGAGAFGPLGVGIGIVAVLSALSAAKEWRDARQELDEMWEDFDFL